MMISKIVEPILRQFDNDERELVLQWRVWKMKWFPYRTAQLKAWDEESSEITLGPWEWHLPMVLKKLFPR